MVLLQTSRRNTLTDSYCYYRNPKCNFERPHSFCEEENSMGIRKISDHKTKEGIAKGLAEWVVVEDGKSITVHDTEENVKKKYGKQKDSPEVVREEEQVESVIENVSPQGLVVDSVVPGGTVSQQLLNVLNYEPRKAADLAAAIGRPVPSTRRTLNDLALTGTVLKTDEGYRRF
jgi:hypothetical protein